MAEFLTMGPEGTAIESQVMNAVITTRAAERTIKGPSDVVLLKQQQSGVAFWGENNMFPQEVNTDIEENDLVDSVLNWKARELVGGGISYGNMVPGPYGYQLLEPMKPVPEIEDFLAATNYELFAMESALDLYTLYNTNAVFHLGPKNRINALYCEDQSWLRLKENDKNGDITEAYLTADWSTVSSVKDKKVIRLPALDPYFDLPGQLRSLADSNARILLPIRYQVRGRKYYALAPWNGIRVNHVLTLAKAIFQAKSSIVKHTMASAMHIEIADGYWALRFGKEWEDAKEPEARRKLMKKEIERWEKTLAGEKNAGKNIVTRMIQAKHTNELTSLVKITPLKNALPDGALVEDSAETDHHIIRALGVDPSLVGISPSKNRQSGSGSDKRVARTNYLLAERPHGRLLTNVLTNVVSPVNGWPKAHNKGRPITFQYTNLYAATLDQSQQVSARPNSEKQTDNGAN